MPTYTVVRNEPVGAQLHWLVFDRAPVAYVEPGQFVAATVAETQAYFAIASSPGEPLELLVKRVGDAAESVCALGPGDSLEATDALGKGFGAAATRPRPLVCLVNGSAISAVRPVIEREVSDGLPRPVTLLYGVLSPAHRGFVDDLGRWATAGVHVVEVLDEAFDDWEGAVGYVQHHAMELGLIRDDVAVILCGVPPMIAAATKHYTAAGLAPEWLLTNY
jgi:CDP-4-dehydro-6-deoxyglucose reductase